MQEFFVSNICLLSSKKRSLLGGKYQPILSRCMKQIFTMMMTLLIGAVSMSALGLGMYGVKAALVSN